MLQEKFVVEGGFLSRFYLRALSDTFLTNVLVVLCGLFTGILTARFLLPEGRGALAAVLYWPQLLAGLGIMGIDDAVVYRTGLNHDVKRKNIKVSSFWLCLVLSFFVVLLGLALIPVLLGEKREGLWSLSKIYLLFFVPFNFVALTLLGSDQGKLNFSAYNRLRLLTPVLYLAGLLILLLFGKVTVFSVVMVNLISIILVTTIRILIEEDPLLSKPLLSDVYKILKYGSSFHIATACMIVAAFADRFVILHLWDNKILGMYMAALTIAATALSATSNAFHTVLFPTLTTSPKDQQSSILTSGIRQSMFMLVLVTLPLMVLSPWLVPLLFGKAFEPATKITILLLFAYLLVSMKNIVVRSLRGFGEGIQGGIAEIISVASFFVFVFPLSSTLYILAIPVALAVGNSCALLYLGYHLKENHKIELSQCWGLTPLTGKQFFSAIINLKDSNLY